MIKAERSPLKTILFSKTPIITNMMIEKRINPQETRKACCPKKAGARKAITAMRAVHGTSGAMRMVRMRAGRESMTRVPMMAGTLQPNPRNRGKKDLPCRPIMCMMLSMT